MDLNKLRALLDTFDEQMKALRKTAVLLFGGIEGKGGGGRPGGGGELPTSLELFMEVAHGGVTGGKELTRAIAHNYNLDMRAAGQRGAAGFRSAKKYKLAVQTGKEGLYPVFKLTPKGKATTPKAAAETSRSLQLVNLKGSKRAVVATRPASYATRAMLLAAVAGGAVTTTAVASKLRVSPKIASSVLARAVRKGLLKATKSGKLPNSPVTYEVTARAAAKSEAA